MAHQDFLDHCDCRTETKPYLSLCVLTWHQSTAALLGQAGKKWQARVLKTPEMSQIWVSMPLLALVLSDSF
jgi:hypothetical protein